MDTGKKLAVDSTFESINSNAINDAVLHALHDMEEQEKIGL